MPGALSPASSGGASARGFGEKPDAPARSPAPPAPGVAPPAVHTDEQMIAAAPSSQSNAAEMAPRRLVIRLGRPQRASSPSAGAPQPGSRGDSRDDTLGASGSSFSGEDSAPTGRNASDSAGLSDSTCASVKEPEAPVHPVAELGETSPEATQIPAPIDDADWSAARDADSTQDDGRAVLPRWTLDVPPGAPRVWLARRAYAPFAPLFSRRAVLRAVSCAPGRPMVDVRLRASDLSPAAPPLIQRALWGGFESTGDCPPMKLNGRSCILYTASTNDGQWYTDDSDAAAVVAHVLGAVRADVCATFEVGSGRASYASVSRHGVASRPWAGGRPHDGYSIRLVSVRRDTGMLGRKRKAAPRVGAYRGPSVTIRFCGRTAAPLRSTADLGAALAGALSAPIALVRPDGREIRVSPAGGAQCRVATSDGTVAHEGVPWAEIAWAPGGVSLCGEFFAVRGYRHVQ